MPNDSRMQGLLQYYQPRPMRSTPWRSFLDESLCARAQEAALLVAARMSEPAQVQQTVLQISIHRSLPGRWDLSFPSAVAELALFYRYVAQCFPEQGWQAVGRRYLHLLPSASQHHALTSFALHGPRVAQRAANP